MDTKSVASDAYVYGYPLVLMEATRVTGAPANQFSHARSLPMAANRTIVRQNQDTLYSQAWLDLSGEPIVMTVPVMDGKRFWMMPTLDAWTNVTQNPSSINPQVKSGTGKGPFTYAFTGPNWKGTLPDGLTPLPMPTDMAWILGRIEINGEADLPAVHAIQDQLKLAPLSAWQQNHDAANPAVDASSSGDPEKEVAAMDGRTFFNKLNALMVANPPAADDAEALKRFATIGIKPGGTVDSQPADQLDAGAADAKQRIQTWPNPDLADENGWQFGTTAGRYGANYMLRANVALIGLGANLPEDAVYPSMFDIPADDNGTPRALRIHFPAGQLPPVDAFWSITAYTADGFFVDNPANIYAVGHQVPPVANPDGSIDIYVQSAEPEEGMRAANWLPIPTSGKFSLTMRLYAAHKSVIDGSWKPPALTPAS
ncbi:DUF1254 domain-containing protein [Nocardia sp. NPDC005825]|uniref:DUF1254 domain-containing protein n=1 Tax=unclassified Nocardia TaxID=2637762 RepID=UPI0033CE174C